MSPFLTAISVKGRIINALFVRALLAEHGKTKIGYLVAIIKPLSQIIILSVMFTVIGRTAAIGDSIALFLATGIIPYNLCKGLIDNMMQINKSYRSILSSTQVTPFDISVALLLSQTVVLLLASGIILLGLGNFGYWDHRVDSFLGILLTTLASIALGYSVGLFNVSLAAIVPSYEKVWKILSMPLFIMSGIIFIVDQRFPPHVIAILKYNPLLHITESMRDSFYRSWESTLFDLSYLLWFILCALITGLLLQKLTQKRARA